MTETGLAQLFQRLRPLASALAACALAVFAPGPSTAQTQPQQPAALIVLDGSGSMAGPLAGTRLPKIGLAREAIVRGLSRVPSELKLGIAAFGHRRGDCGDIEIMRQPEPVDAPRIGQLLEKVSPRGRGPLTQALRMAARELPQSKATRSLILVHDDADNCTIDLCALAGELAKANIVVHAIGLALKPEDRPKMACLPQLTGGKLYLPTTPEQVGAAVEEALMLASAGAIPKSAPPPVLEGADAQSTVPDAAAPGLYLRARLSAQSAEIMRQPLHWTILPEGEGKVPVFAGLALNPFLALPAGRYVVEVREGPAQAKGTVSVSESKPTVLVLPLEAGTLRVRVAAARAGLALPNTNVSIARPPAADPSTNAPPGEIISAFSGANGTLLLPAGRYLVRAEAGLARSQKLIDVGADASTGVDLALDAGLVQLAAGNTSAQQPAIFAVFEDDPDSPRGRREILRTAQRAPEIVLPPGTYAVELRQAGIEARERIVVVSGEIIRRTLTLPAGQVALSTRVGTQILGDQVYYFVERIDGAGAEITTTSRPQPTLLLAAGRYRIESRFGPINARAAREVEVRAGMPVQQIVFEQVAGNLRLRAQNPPGEVFWDVRDGRGLPVWSTGQPEPELTLQAGQYLVRAFARDRQVEKSLDLRAGERTSLDMSFE